MSGEYANTFKRDFYYNVLDSLQKVNVVFLMGPRKCGKTWALKQLCDAFHNAKYVDFKSGKSRESELYHELIVSLKAV